MSSSSSRVSRRSLWMLAAATSLLLMQGCVGMPRSWCPPDQLTALPTSLLSPCQPAQCLLPSDFAAPGRNLQGQAAQVDAAHVCDVKAWAACAAHHQQLVDWIKARAVAAPK